VGGAREGALKMQIFLIAEFFKITTSFLVFPLANDH
jgi:hypothetical protein